MKYETFLAALNTASDGDFIVKRAKKNFRVFKSANVAFVWGGGYRNRNATLYYMKTSVAWNGFAPVDLFMKRLAELTRQIENAKAARIPRSFADSLGYFIYE